MDNYKDLEVWQLALDQCMSVYNVTKNFPKEEMYGLVSQLRRASVSVVSNIAEGFVRKHNGEFKQFLNTGIGSNSEIEAQLIISNRLDYLSKEDFDKLVDKNSTLGKKLTSLYNSIVKY